MGIKKGSTRLTWVISLIPCVIGLFFLLARLIQCMGVNIFPDYGSDFVEIGILWLCGFVGIWLIYWSILFIVRGFNNPDYDNREREFEAMDKVRLHDGHVGSQGSSEVKSVSADKSQKSGEFFNQPILSGQQRNHDCSTKKRRTIVRVGSSIIIFFVIIFGAKSLGRQAGRQAAIHDIQQELTAQNAPTGFMGAKWLMSKSQVKSLLPDAIELVHDDLKLDSTAFSRPAFIDFVFHQNLLDTIVITFKGEKTKSMFRLTHLLVINEYGEFPEPSCTNGYIMISKKSIGKISIEHNLYNSSGLPVEQVMLYKMK